MRRLWDRMMQRLRGRTMGRQTPVATRRAAPATQPAPPTKARLTTRQAPATKPAPPTRRPTVVSTPPHRGRRLVYAPQPDGQADPGEVIWTWVPYEEEPSQGKDRPVLVIGRDGVTLHGLMLSSNADREGQPHWLALGPGTWDRQNRPSWVRLDRVLVVDEDGIRREGAVLDRRRFDAVAAELRRGYGWT